MREFFEKIPPVLILVVIVSIIRGVMKLLKPRDAKPSAGGTPEDNEEQRRVREIQERIRRIAAERRGQRPTAPVPPPLSRPPLHVPPPPLPAPARLPEPVRMSVPHSPPAAPVRSAELERQQQLQDKLRELAERKFLTERHAAHVAEAQREADESETGQRTTARARLLGDLSDPASVRRAFVLREVLGAPVGLR